MDIVEGSVLRDQTDQGSRLVVLPGKVMPRDQWLRTCAS
jgi:hypothetical protein